jgi:hypothetical protein
MKNYYLLGKLWVCLLLSHSLFAQKPHVVVIEPEAIQLSNRKFHIAQIRDERLVKTNIGVVQKGLANRQTEAILPNKLEVVFQYYFDKSLPKLSEESSPIVLIISDLQISERTYAMKEVGKAQLTLTFCIEENYGLKKLYTAQAHEENNGMDVTGGHPKRIRAVFLKCLEEFNTKFASFTQSPAESLAESKENRQEGLIIQSDNTNLSLMDSNKGLIVKAQNNIVDDQAHILTCKSPKMGIYQNFQELLTNSPSNTTAFKLEARGDFVMIRDIQNNKKIKEAFGFFDGNSFYINTLNYSPKKLYAKVLTVGRYFAWIDNYQSPTAAGLAGGGGLLGALIVSSDLDCIFLDINSGVISVAKKDTMERMLSEDKELLNKYLQIGGKRNPQIQLNLIHEFNQRHSVK